MDVAHREQPLGSVAVLGGFALRQLLLKELWEARGNALSDLNTQGTKV
jgi:hypothetical protein